MCMRNKKRLKPCPFCGNKELTMNYYPADGVNYFRDRYAVTCDYRKGGCGAESGHYHSVAEAEYVWNQRKRRWSDG